MKHTNKILFGALLLICLQLGYTTGCVGYVGGGGGGVYYGGGPWFQDDVVVTGGGRGWYGHDNGYAHPGGGFHR
jgi:hypothetical protein